MCDSRLIAPYPREPLTHCAWSRRQGVRAGNLSYLDPMFFRAGRLVDRMSSSSLDSRPRIMQFSASLEQQLAVRITTRSRFSYQPDGSPHSPGVSSSTELPAGSRK